MGGRCETAAFHARPSGRTIVQFRYPSPYVAVGRAGGLRPPELLAGPSVCSAAAIDLMHRIHREFRFDPGATTVDDAGDAGARGSPRRLPGLRAPADRLPADAGLAGALRQRLSADRPAARPAAAGRRRCVARLAVGPLSALGWVDLDPTNDVLPETRHVTTAWGRDYGDVSPLRGVVLGGQHQTLRVGVNVAPVSELMVAPIA